MAKKTVALAKRQNFPKRRNLKGMKKIKRYFAVLLSVIMVISSVPITAFASDKSATWTNVGTQKFHDRHA